MNKLMLIGVLGLVITFDGVAETNKNHTRATSKVTSNFCKVIQKKLHTVVSKESNPEFPVFEIDKYYLWSDQTNTFNNIDVDNDGESDTVVLGCSSSVDSPSDPCLLTATLSSTGTQFDLSAWNIRLMKIKSKFYVLAHHDDKARYKLYTESTKKDEGYIYHPEVAASIKYQLYELTSTGLLHACKNI